MSGATAAFARAASRNAVAPPFAVPRSHGNDRLLQAPVALLVWVLIVMMIVPEGFDYRMLASGDIPTAGSALTRLLWLSLLVGGALLVAWRARLAWLLTLSSLNIFLVLFALLAVLSIAWSIDPSLSMRRVVRMLTILGVAAAFVLVGWHAWRFQNVVRPLLTLMLGGSLIFGLVAPELAIHHEVHGMIAGDWKGLANHKNALGNLACIGLIFWVHAGLARQARLVAVAAGSGVAMTCLVLSDSVTSMLTAAFVVIFLLLMMRSPTPMRGYLPWVVAAFVAALTLYSLALLQVIPGISKLFGPVSMLTGKDMSFTGRTDIWRILIEHMRMYPVLGSGYGAYWPGIVPGTLSYAYVEQLGFYPASAHNGYLETVNALGAVGLLLLLGYLLVYVRQGIRLLAFDRAQAALYLGLFLQQGITNLSESRWLSVQAVDFVIMALATTALARSLLEMRRQQEQAAADHAAVAYPDAPRHHETVSVGGDGDAARL